MIGTVQLPYISSLNLLEAIYHGDDKQYCAAAYLRYWSLMLRSWIRSGRKLFIFLSVSL